MSAEKASTFGEFVVDYSYQVGLSQGKMREGQIFFNCLLAHNTLLAQALRTTPRDPYFSEKVSPEVWDWITTNWESSQ